MQRSLAALPKQGSRTPWKLHQNYLRDVAMLKAGPVEDDALEFSDPRSATAPAEPVAA